MTNTLKDICRSCLEPPTSRMYPLLGGIANVEVSIASMLEYCSAREVNLDDDLPGNVCLMCFKTIRIAYNFLKKFEEAESILNQKLDTEYNEASEEIGAENNGDKEKSSLIENPDGTANTDENSLDDIWKVDNYFGIIHNYAENQDEAQIDYSSGKSEGQSESNTDEEITDFKEEIMDPEDTWEDTIEDELEEDQQVIDGGPENSDQTSVEEYLQNFKDEDGKISITRDASIEEFLMRLELKNKMTSKQIKLKKQSPTKRMFVVRGNYRSTFYSCPMCNHVSTQFRKFYIHLITHNTATITCTRCPLELKLNIDDFCEHYNQCHKYQCNICSKSLTSSYGYMYHMKKHESLKPFKCPYENCPKMFYLLVQLKKHLPTHTGEYRYTCKLCNAKFKTYDTFRYHQKTHDGRRNHLCTHCGKAFFQAVHLRDHMYRHTGFKRFCCDICGIGFITNSQLKKHQRYCSRKIKIK